MGSAKHMRNNGEEIKIHQHDNYQMPGAYKQMGDMNKNQPMKGYNHMDQPGKISGGAAKYISESYATPKITDPNKPENPTKEKMAADAKIKSNPEFNVNSPLPEGSSDIGGEIVGSGQKTIVRGNFNRGTNQSLTSGNFPKFNVNNAINSDSMMAQQDSGQRRTDLVKSMVNSSPSDAEKQLDEYKVSQGNRTYKGAGSDLPGAPDTVREFYKNNPSTRGKEYLGTDLSIESYQPKPKFKASGAPGLYKHDKK